MTAPTSAPPVADDDLPRGHDAVDEKPPVDPGCLPAWSVAELPAPVPFRWRNLIALIGPGIVLIGTSMGTGEWIMGPQTAFKLGGAFLIVVPIAIICQVILNTEVMRYTLLTGEPIFTGFMRTKPGHRFWIPYYLLLDCVGWWPSLAGLSAQILLFAMLGPIVGDDPDRQRLVLQVSCFLLAACAVLLCFGGKVYNTIEVVLSGKVFFALGYTTFLTLIFVPWSVWAKVFNGMFNPMATVHYVQSQGVANVDWTLIATLAGFAGVGGLGNTVVSNFVREKGWGMGSLVGAIPSAFGAHQIKLSHLGTITRNSTESLARFKRWWAYILVDQYGFWAIGSIVGMLLPCVLGMAYLKTDYIQGKEQWEAAASLARDVGLTHGEIFTKLTLLCGFVILFPGQFGAMDSLARRWCDALWSGSRRLRNADPGRVRVVYYTFVFSYAVGGICLNQLGISPPKMMQIAGNLANLSLLCCLIHTLYVNTHFLPKPFQPSLAKRAAMVAAACVYVCFFSLSVYNVWPKIISGELFR